MEFNFDKMIDRSSASGTHSSKWQGYANRFPGFNINEQETLSMWVADMDFETLDTVKQALHKRIDHGIFGYTSNSNNDAYFNAAIGWFARRYSWNNCDPSWMVFSPSIVPAIYASVQAFTDKGDGVIVQPPVYYPFYTAITDNDRVIAANQLHENNLHYTMDYKGLEALAKKPTNKLAIFCSPHNPVGRVWTEEELTRAFEICAKYDLIIVCDEIHADLIMPQQTFVTAGRLKTFHDRIIIAHSASKTFNLAGLTSALITIPNIKLRKQFCFQYTKSHMPRGNTFGPLAGAVAYNTGDEYADKVMCYIAENFKCVSNWLMHNLPEVRITPAEGTYLAWLDFRGLSLEKDEIYHQVIEGARIAGDLGTWFGDCGAGFMRFNFACPRSRITEFIKRMDTQFGKQR